MLGRAEEKEGAFRDRQDCRWGTRRASGQRFSVPGAKLWREAGKAALLKLGSTVTLLGRLNERDALQRLISSHE